MQRVLEAVLRSVRCLVESVGYDGSEMRGSGCVRSGMMSCDEGLGIGQTVSLDMHNSDIAGGTQTSAGSSKQAVACRFEQNTFVA